MRCLERNKKAFYYATFNSTQAVKEDDLFTGAEQVVYNTPVLTKAFISGERSDSYENEMGINNTTTREIIMDDLTCPIAIDSVLWIDVIPNQQGTQKHDYCVLNVNKSLNYISITAKKIL